MSEYKQAILVRKDLEMSTGKMIAQGAHASLKAFRNTDEEERKKWIEQGEKKIVLDPGTETLVNILEESRKHGLPTGLVKDAGMTELEPGTTTALALGPAEETKLDKVTEKYELV